MTPKPVNDETLPAGVPEDEVARWLELVALGEATLGGRVLTHVGELFGASAPPWGPDWESTGSFGIQTNVNRDYWDAGRVTALLPLETGGVLIGAETGGAWLATTNGSAFSVSNDWDFPNVLALARGTLGSRHVYAGCQGALYETDHTSGFPMLNWRAITTLGWRVIYAIAIVPGHNAIVLATDDGVWWSSIASTAAGYAWTQAGGLPTGPTSSVALGSGDVVHAAAWGVDATVGRFGMFIGQWSGAALTFQPAAVNGLDPKMMGRTSIASCPTDRTVAYAIASTFGPEKVLGVLGWDDSGRAWNALSVSLDLGNQGEHNQCIAVSTTDPNLVAVGWRTAGPVISRDGGKTWTVRQGDSLLHSDLNALEFDPEDETNQTLLIGSDGGVLVTRDLGDTFDSGYNRNLGNLQFLREPFGTSSGSAQVAGLYGGGLQDNGNVYQVGAGEPWRHYDGGDGHCMQFLSNGALLRFANGTNGVRISRWNGNYFDEHGNVNGPGHFTGAFEPKTAPVARPRFKNQARNVMIAAGGLGSAVFGFFDDAYGHVYCDYLGSVPDGLSIEGIGADTGETIFAGTSDARLFAVDSKTGGFVELNVAVAITADRPKYQVLAPQVRDSSIGYALLFRSGGSAHLPTITGAAHGQVLRSRGLLKWEPLPNVPTTDGPIYSIVADWASGGLFAASDSTVWVSHDEGETWVQAGTGLPRRVHCSDLRVVDNGADGRWLYLATYGRSAWRLRL